jgi:predicted nucleotidyltransferase
MVSLKDFMISKTRVKLMELFFAKPEELYFVRDITRLIKEEINAVRRELDKMLGYGLLKSEQRGNRLYYTLNPKYPFYSELRQMISKTTGIGQKIIKNRRKLGSVDYVMFSGSFVEGKTPKQGEVDVLVIGDIVLPELQELIKEQQEKIGREINYAVFSFEEFDFRKTRRDPFIMDILFGSRVMVIGSDTEFSERKIAGI